MWLCISTNFSCSNIITNRLFLLRSQLCVLTLTQCPFHLRVTAVAHKSTWPFCQKWRWQVTPKHAYTFDPTKSEWADYATVKAWCWNLSGDELTCKLSGNVQLAEPLSTDLCQKSGISVRELISTKKKKKRRQGMNRRTTTPTDWQLTWFW